MTDDDFNGPTTDTLEILESNFVLAPSENYRGISYTELVIRWTRWLMSSLNDSQQGDLVFLRGNIENHSDPDSYFVGPRLEVEQDSAILVPIVTTFYRIGDLDGSMINDEDRLRQVLHEHIEAAGPIWATIKTNSNSGQNTKKVVKNLENFKFESTTFWLTVSSKNPFLNKMDVYLEPGSNTAMAGGYFVLLKDLPPSRYFVRFGGKGFGNFYTDSLYEINVRPKVATRSKDISGEFRSPETLIKLSKQKLDNNDGDNN
jgi:hypothetical protein